VSSDTVANSSRATVLFGSTGQIGSALAKALKGSMLVRPRWSEGADWPRRAFAAIPATMPCDIVFAGGVTDPQLPDALIREANAIFPAQIIAATLDRPAIRYVTLGTVMENFPEVCEANAYLRSKRELGDWLVAQASSPNVARRIRHVRLHTIYGGADKRFLKPHMFLGQVALSLISVKEFRMSSGEQIREYHHADDIAQSLAALLDRHWLDDESSIVQINSGAPVRLGELATELFRAFGREKQLRIGMVPRPKGENLNRIFPRSEAWLLPVSREPIHGVTQWLRTFVSPEGSFR
jgi:nucleoside-diphosphate-sugar epimerase